MILLFVTDRPREPVEKAPSCKAPLAVDRSARYFAGFGEREERVHVYRQQLGGPIRIKHLCWRSWCENPKAGLEPRIAAFNDHASGCVVRFGHGTEFLKPFRRVRVDMSC